MVPNKSGIMTVYLLDMIVKDLIGNININVQELAGRLF